MRVPQKVLVAIEQNARLILKGESSYEEALDALEVLVEKEEHRLFRSWMLRSKLRAMLKSWIASQVAVAADDDVNGNQTLPFPDLPATLEIAVGRFVHQKCMTRHDWMATIVQYRTKAENAAGMAQRVERAAERALQLLTNDTQTLADIEVEV